MNNRACNGTVPALSLCAINTRALISYGREGDNLEIVLNGSKGSQSAGTMATWKGYKYLFLNFRFTESELQKLGCFLTYKP